jgi:redox-sensitive bicupin YhaK (pirin superfamily)
MISVRPGEQRGEASFGWLDSRHTFSFGGYYDPEHMGFSALRVINDDRVVPGAGFETHSHRDMEIISYVLSGEMMHRDSEGNSIRLPAGEFQLMSAGSGIEHSEFNTSTTEPLHFLQIWLQPAVYGQPPNYQQQDFGQQTGLTLVASPDGAEGSLVIKQNARLYQLVLPAREQTSLPASDSRRYYVHVIDGSLQLDGNSLRPGDGARLESMNTLEFTAGDMATRALLFDLP